MPHQLNGEKAKPNDPTTWATFEALCGSAKCSSNPTFLLCGPCGCRRIFSALQGSRDRLGSLSWLLSQPVLSLARTVQNFNFRNSCFNWQLPSGLSTFAVKSSALLKTGFRDSRACSVVFKDAESEHRIAKADLKDSTPSRSNCRDFNRRKSMPSMN